MPTNNALSQAIAAYTATNTRYIEIVTALVTQLNAGNQPYAATSNQGVVIRNLHTLNATTYSLGDRILVAMLNEPIALGKITLNPDR